MNIRLLLLSTLITFSLAAQEKDAPKEEPVVDVIFEEPVEEQVVDQDEDRVFIVVEEMPTFPGGMTAQQDFIKKNLKYPAADKRQGVEGTVYIQFVVSKSDGHLDNPQVIKGVSTAIDKEALRIISLMPKWIVGKQNGKAVNCRYVLPMKFKLDPK